MKPQVPWSVKGIDEDARAAAKDAARRSGMTLGAWLNHLILKESEARGESRGPAGDSPGEMAARLDEIARKLNALTAEEQQTAVSRVMPSGDEGQGEAALAALLGRIDEHERQTGARISELVHRIEALSREVAAVGERIAQDAGENPSGYLALDTALRNVVEHIETADAQNQSALASIQQRLAELGVRSSAAPEAASVTAALQKLEAHVADMAGELRNRITRAEVEALIHDETAPLSARIDRIDRSAQAMLEQASAAAAEAAKRGLEDVDATIEALVRQAQSAQDSEVRLLRATVDAMSRHLGEPMSGSGITDLEQRVADLDHRLSEVAAAPSVDQALADLDARISAIDTALVTQLATQRFGAFDAAAPADADLATRFDDLTLRLDKTEGQLSHLETIETAITQLYQVLEENRSQIETAAVGGSLTGEGQPTDVTALAQGLAAVQQAAAESDRRTQETLQAVHETLEQIIARLSDIGPGDIAGDANADVDEPVTASEPGRPVAAPEISYLGEAWSEPRSQSRPETGDDPFASTGEGWGEPQTATTAEPEPVEAPQPVTWQRPVFGQRSGPVWTEAVRAHLAQTADHDGRREPAFVEPPLAPNAWDQAGVNETAPAGDDQKVRTDFIAAARRAAQAAAAAGVPAEDEPAPSDEPVSRLKSVLRMLKRSSDGAVNTDKGSRKRLILAGLLLLAAASAFALKGRLTNDVPTALPATTAPAPASANTDETSGVAAKTAPAASSAAPPSDQELTLKASPPPVPAVTGTAGLADTGSTSSLGDVIGGVPGPEAGPAALRNAAAAGDRVAQFVVASNYLDDRGKRPDYAAAALWLEKSARQGLAPAEYRLGTLFERGRGVPLDLREAALLYDSAARKGNVRAMHNLAVINTGTNGTAEFTVAAYWFGQAASYGLKDSQFNLAILYERGMGVEKDLAQAYFWYALAARQGDPDARARVEALKGAVESSLPEITRKLAAFQPRVPDREANAVAVADPQWRAEVPALPPAPALVPATAPQAKDSRALQPGTENAVESAQKMLMKLGFDPGAVDGQMGARTANAIRLFQLENGLPVNGAVSADLLAALADKAG